MSNNIVRLFKYTAISTIPDRYAVLVNGEEIIVFRGESAYDKAYSVARRLATALATDIKRQDDR